MQVEVQIQCLGIEAWTKKRRYFTEHRFSSENLALFGSGTLWLHLEVSASAET